MDQGEEKETIGSGGGGVGGTINSLLCLCVRKLAFDWEPAQMDQLRTFLPASLFLSIVNLIEDVKKLATIFPTDVIQRLPEKCFVMNPESRKLDVEKTILASEPFLSKLDFFDLCSKMALEQPAERVYQTMSESEQDKLENMDSIEPVVWCRALELSPRRAILHYDDIALSCAAGGYLRALERNLLKVRGGEDTALLQRCALTAILNGHFHVANAIQIDNFSTAFHYFFPDGHPPPTFIANLLDTKLLKPEVGEQIFEEIIDWLSKLDVQWLMRAIEREEPKIPGYVRQRLEWKYRECVDRREYPCNDWD